MLGKNNRLVINGRLKHIKTITSSFFILKVAKNQNQKKRFAIIVGKGVDKRAVYRNKLKRTFNHTLGEFVNKIQPGFDFLIIAKKEALNKQKNVLQEEMWSRLKEEGLTT